MKKEVKEVETKTQFSNELLQQIEDNRVIYVSKARKLQLAKTLIGFGALLAVVIGFVLCKTLVKNEKLAGNLILVIAIVGIVCLFISNSFFKKKSDLTIREYFKIYFKSQNAYAFDEEGFSDIVEQYPGKITLEEFNESRLYKDVFECGSRNLTTYKYKSLDLSVVDCSGHIKAAKRIAPAFVGKMVRGAAKYKGSEPIYIYWKGNEKALPPTGIEDVKVVLDNDKIIIRSNYEKWEEVINAKVMKLISEVEVNDILCDVALSIYDGKVFVMLGYDDPLMIPAFESPLKEKPNKILKNDMIVTAKLIEVLNK